MVYISSQNFTTSMRLSVQQTESALSTAQQEVSSGTYADLGLQLGGQVSTAISLTQQSSTLTSYLGSNASASTRLSATSTALDSILTGAQNLSNLLITSADTGGTSSALQTQAQTNLQSLLGTLNTSVGTQFIFGGINTGQPPASDLSTNQSAVNAALAQDIPGLASDPSQVTAATITAVLADPTSSFNQLFTTSGTSPLTSASATPITSQISSSTTAATSVSAKTTAIQTISRAYSLLTALSAQNLNADASQAVISAASSLISQGIAGLTTVQSNIGVTQNSITDANSQISAQQTVLTGNVDDLESVDTYTLSTKITALQTQLQDAYSLTNQLKSLSLVNYLTA